MYFSNFNGICAVKHKNNQIVAGLLFFHIIFGLAGILPLGSSLSASYAILENPIILILFLSFRRITAGGDYSFSCEPELSGLL